VNLALSFRPKKEQARAGGEAKRAPEELRNRTVALILIGIWVVAALLILTPRRPDNGKVSYRAEFPASCGFIKLMVYKPPLAPVLGKTIALLVISSGPRSNTLYLDHEEWRRLSELWKATQTGDLSQSEGNAYGGGLSDPGKLTLDVVDDARFEISSKRGPTITCHLPRSRFVAFGRAIDEVSARVSGELTR
jgi:hypothetical protein